MTETVSKTTYKPRTLPFVILGVIILLTAVAVSVWWMSQVEAKKPHPAVKNTPLVTLQPVLPADNQATLTAGGFVHAKYRSNIAAEVNGTVLSLSPDFVVGRRVKKGEVLAGIDDRNYVAALANAKAGLASAKSLYAQEQARARQSAHDAKRLNVKPSQLLLRKPQLAAAKEAIVNAKAQLKLAQQNLAKTTIIAPFDAIVQSRNIAIGDSVTVNTVVAQLVAVDTFTVKLMLDSDLFDLIDIGNQVTLTNSMTGVNYQAVVNRFDPALDKSTRMVGVYVDIQHPLSGEKPLLLNTYLQAKITGKTLAKTMWIDNQASVENQFVWVKGDDNRLAKVPFTLFYRDSKRSLVRFDDSIRHFINNPKDSFFAGEKVTTEKQQASKKQTNDAITNKDGQGG